MAATAATVIVMAIAATAMGTERRGVTFGA